MAWFAKQGESYEQWLEGAGRAHELNEEILEAARLLKEAGLSFQDLAQGARRAKEHIKRLERRVEDLESAAKRRKRP